MDEASEAVIYQPSTLTRSPSFFSLGSGEYTVGARLASGSYGIVRKTAAANILVKARTFWDRSYDNFTDQNLRELPELYESAKREVTAFQLFNPGKLCYLAEAAEGSVMTPRIIMERLPGKQLEAYLKEVIKASNIDLETKKRYILRAYLSLAEKLHHAHQDGWVHGDVSTSNALINVIGPEIVEGYLIDFDQAFPVGAQRSGLHQYLRPPYWRHPELFTSGKIEVHPRQDVCGLFATFNTDENYQKWGEKDGALFKTLEEIEKILSAYKHHDSMEIAISELDSMLNPDMGESSEMASTSTEAFEPEQGKITVAI